MRERVQDRRGLVDLVRAVGQGGLKMVEIGSFAGESAQVFIGTGQVDSIICVDIWRYENRGYNNSYPNITDAERRFDAMMAASGGRALKYKGDIDQFIASDLFRRFEGGIDLVYIDALHTYEGCMHDICRTMRFIKPRLAVSGHDYASDLPHVQGVKRAVDDFFGKPDMTFCDSSWIKFNKETTSSGIRRNTAQSTASARCGNG